MGKQWTPPSSDIPVNNTAWTPPSTDEEVKKKVDGDSSGGSSDTSSAPNTPSGTNTNPDQPSFSSLTNPLTPQVETIAPFVNQATKDQIAPDITDANNSFFRKPNLNVKMAAATNAPLLDDESSTSPLVKQQQAMDDAQANAEAQYNKEHPGTWGNVFPLLTHTITQMVVKPVAALSNIERDLIGATSTDSNPNDAAKLLYKNVPIYNENGTLVDTKQELTDYGKEVDAGRKNDVLGRLILGFDSYNNETDKSNTENPLPHTFIGNTTSGMIGIAPDLLTSSLFPEGEAEQLAANRVFNLKNAVWNPFTKYMAVKGAMQGYDEAKQQGDTPIQAVGASLKESGYQALQAGGMGLLGGIGGDIISPKLYKSLTDNGLISGGRITKFGVDAATDAALFGAYPIASNLIQGKPINIDEIESGIGTGIVFAGMKSLKSNPEQSINDDEKNNIIGDRQAIAVQNFANANLPSIVEAYNLTDSSGDLNAKAVQFAAQAKEENNPAKKAELIATASTLAKASDIKATANAIVNNKDEFIESINNSDMDDNEKQSLISKFEDVSNVLNPHAIQQHLDENAVHTLSNNIDALQANGSPDPVTDPEGVNNLIDAVQQRTDLQVKMLDKASQPQPFIPEPGEQTNGPEKEIPQTGPTGAENETEEQEPVSGNNGVDSENAANREATVLPGTNGENNQPEESAAASNDNNNAGGSAETAPAFTFNSKEHGELKISPLDNGEYNVKFEDGTNLELSSKEIKDHFNFDTDKINAPENIQRLHATDDADDIAKMYDDKLKELKSSGDKESEIALYGPRTDEKSFSDVNDKNNITNGIRLNYFKKAEGNSSVDLHNQADEINQNSYNGKSVVSANDIAQFMIDHPGGAATHFTVAGNPELREIGNRYEELTGKEFTNRLAKKLATEFGNVGVGEINAFQHEIEGGNNIDRIKRLINDELNSPGLHDVNKVADTLKNDLDSYITDPTNDWNWLYPVLKGEELTPEEATEIKKVINEQKDEQLGGAENDSGNPDEADGDAPIEEESGTNSSGERKVDASIGTSKRQGIIYRGDSDLDESKKTATNEDIIQRLREAVDEGHIGARQADLAEALLKSNPELFKNLAFYIGGTNNENMLGYYDAYDRLIRIFSGANDLTSLHELFHHSERFLPDDVRGEILKDWHESLKTERENIRNKINASVDDVEKERLAKIHTYLNNAEELHVYTDTERPDLYDKMIGQINTKDVPLDYYKYLNPSEWWAENASNKFAELQEKPQDNSWLGKAKQWYTGLVNGIKKIFGITKETPIEKGINAILNGETSDDKIRTMLKSSRRFQSIGDNSRPMRTPGETMANYARRLIDWEKDQRDNETPKNKLRAELEPVRQNIKDINRAFKEGYNQAKAETKSAFLEYDVFKSQMAREALERQRENSKEKFLEYDKYQKDKQQSELKKLKDRYDAKLQAEKNAHQQQAEKLKGGFKNIRTGIKDIIVKLNRSGAFGGVKFNDKQLLSFADHLNNVTTERGLDNFRDFVSKAVQNADVIRDVNDSRAGIKDAKKLLKADYVPQNIKSVIKDLVKLNPYKVSDPKEFKSILDDLNNGQRSKEFSDKTVSEIRNFIDQERQNDLNDRVGKLTQDHTEIYNSEDHNTYKNSQVSTLPDQRRIRDMASDIVNDPDTKHYEKVRKLNNLNDAVNMYGNELNDAVRINPDGVPEADRPVQGFNSILDNIENKPVEISDTQRDHLEDLASARQASIDIHPDMSDEQKASLKILQDVPLAGQDANTLRLFNNVLDNVVNNDDHSGIGIFEAKAIGNSDEGALKLVNYLKSINTKVRDARLNMFGKFRSLGADESTILGRIANNDFTFQTKLNTGTHFDEIKKGFSRVKQEFHKLVTDKVADIFRQYPDLHDDAAAAQRLSLFSYLNQNREFSSPDEADSELQKRINTIHKDIVLKSQEGLKQDNEEAAIENHIFEGMATKIKEATGVDIHDPEDLKKLTYDDFKKIEFLEPGERAVYDTYRSADDILRPQHEEVVNRQLNKTYEGWNNHMRDGYRLLGSGLTDVVTGDNLGFAVTNEDTSNGSVASMERVKGDPLAQKDAANQRVLNVNFFNTQDQNIQDQLYDIHTLKNRQIFDEALKNKNLRDALGNENHQMYKNAVKANVLNQMGLNEGMGFKELKLANQALNGVAKLGRNRQLFSLLAYAKHYFSNIANTLVHLGIEGKVDAPKLMLQVRSIVKSDAVQDLLKQHPISERAENLAGINVLSNEEIANKKNIVVGDSKNWLDPIIHNKVMDGINDSFTKYFGGVNTDGTQHEALMAKPIKIGDVKSAEWSWVTYYAKHLLADGKVNDFKDIDWDKEAQNPDREAADYAESMTSKQMNENTKAGRSKLIGSQNTGLVAAKYLLFPFGSRNMHNLQTLVEDFRTLASKDTFVNEDYRRNQTTNAVASMAGLLAQEGIFNLVRVGGNLAAIVLFQKGLVYLLSSIFSDDKEKSELLARVDNSIENQEKHFFQKVIGNTISGFIFSGMGNVPEEAFKKGMNKLTNTDLFYEPNLSINQEIANSNNYGMLGAAFNGYGSEIKDMYRTFEPYDKDGVHVNISPYQKSVIATNFLSDFIASFGVSDANFSRSLESMRQGVDYNLASKFGDPNYTDLSAPSPLKIGNKNIKLSDEHQHYYEQIKKPFQQALETRGYDSKRAATLAAAHAKAALISKYGYNGVINDGEVMKKKK